MALNQFPRRSFVGSSTIQTLTGDGTQTVFTLSSAQTQNECFIFVDDVAQVPGVDFTVNSTALTFTSAPANTAEIIVRGFGVPAPVTTVSDGSVTAAKLATGAIEAKLGYTPVSPTQLNNLIDSAPTALDTLNELAAALGDDANYAATITTALGTKANTSSLATVATSGSYNDLSNKPAITPAAVSDQVNTSTGAFDLPSGTTAQRPSSPSTGMIRYNTDRGDLETWNGIAWVKPSEFIASGGSITTSAGYKIHTFTSSGTFQITNGSTNARLLVIGGGGAGGYDVGGGGGAGGYVYQSAVTLSVGSYSIIVGAGASRSTTSGGSAPSGSNSTALGFTALGGGGAGNYSAGSGASGGSGGGGAGYGASTSGGSGTAGQGFAGGNGLSTWGNNSTGGGGGGAGGIGSNSIDAGGSRVGLAPGGVGVSNSISGSAVTYSTGGAGAADYGPDQADAVANTGNGGAGAGQYGPLSNNGAAGGSGIVIISYIA